MLQLTEKVYLAAPFGKPEEREFNERLAELVRSYNFPLVMPQEIMDELASDGQGEVEERFGELCMEVLGKANLVIAVYYGEEFDALTAFEVGFALGRWINVVAIQNTNDPALCRFAAHDIRPATPKSCSRIVVAPDDMESLTDRLIPILNRYFVPHGITPMGHSTLQRKP